LHPYIFVPMVACLSITQHCNESQEGQNGSPSAKLTSEQLNDIIKDEMNTDKGAREVQVQVEDGEEVLDPANTSSVLKMVVSTISNEFKHECLDVPVRLLNADPIPQSTDDCVPGHKYSIPGLPATKFLVHEVSAISLFVRWWVWDADMPEALVTDKMGLGKTFCSVAVAVICPLVCWECCNGVATVRFVGEYPWRVGDFGTQLLSRHCRWRTAVVSPPVIEFCAWLSVGDPVNTTSRASSSCISPWTNPGHYNAQSGWHLQDCHRWDDTWNRFETRQLVAPGKWTSHPPESEQQYWWAGKPMEYPRCVVWYLNIQSETIKQRPILILCVEFWDFWWVPSGQD